MCSEFINLSFAQQQNRYIEILPRIWEMEKNSGVRKILGREECEAQRYKEQWTKMRCGNIEDEQKTKGT